MSVPNPTIINTVFDDDAEQEFTDASSTIIPIDDSRHNSLPCMRDSDDAQSMSYISEDGVSRQSICPGGGGGGGGHSSDDGVSRQSLHPGYGLHFQKRCII